MTTDTDLPIAPAFAHWLGQTNEITRMFLAAGQIPGLINLGGGLPEAETFPAAELAEIARRAIADHPAETLGYGAIEGLAALRAAIARRYATPALQLGPENVLIVSGGMQGLDLIGKALVDPGGVIAAQTPAYLGALDAWRPRLPQYRELRLERPDFDAVAALAGAQFAYTVPNFSNPTGALVGVERRRALVAAAAETGTWLVEDDPYGALYLDGNPLPRMIALAAEAAPGPYAGRVIYMGTLSKEVAPGFRLGWVIAAPEMIAALTIAKQGTDLCSSSLSQRIALEALEGGLVDRIRPGILATYRARRDALCAAMREHLEPWFTWEVPVGGMFVWATARDPDLDTDRLLSACLEHGVCMSPSSVFSPTGGDRRSMRLNFTYNPPERLAEAARRLAAATRSLAEA